MRQDIPESEKFSPVPDNDSVATTDNTQPTTNDLIGSLAKAICRQSIMWPAEGPLACEKGDPCGKRDTCRQLAREALDFSSTLRVSTGS